VISSTRAALCRRAGFRQKGIRSLTQTEAGQALAEFRKFLRKLRRVRQCRIASACGRPVGVGLFARRSRLRQRFYGHPSDSFHLEFG
jgi:hypothetical protein